MSVVTIKVDEALKNGAAAVLDELGLDLPTAIRMYLKSVVRENGLPINTKLSVAPAVIPAAKLDEEAEEALEEDDLIDDVAAPVPAEEEPAAEPEEEPAAEPEEEAAPVLPEEEPAPAVTVDYDTRSGRKAVAALFIDAICSVPEGMLTRWSDMEEGLSAKYGVEVKRPASVRWPAAKDDGTEIPYWRIVGERGAVRGDKMIEQSVQEEKLKAEGQEFAPSGHGIFTGIKVDGYKDKLVKW